MDYAHLPLTGASSSLSSLLLAARPFALLLIEAGSSSGHLRLRWLCSKTMDNGCIPQRSAPVRPIGPALAPTLSLSLSSSSISDCLASKMQTRFKRQASAAKTNVMYASARIRPSALAQLQSLSLSFFSNELTHSHSLQTASLSRRCNAVLCSRQQCQKNEPHATLSSARLPSSTRSELAPALRRFPAPPTRLGSVGRM